MTQNYVILKHIAFAGNLYHQFGQQDDGLGDKLYEKANSGLIFESFQMLDMECAPALIIVASDVAHHGNAVFRPMYCKLLFDVLFLTYLFFTNLFFSMLISLQA